MYHILCCIHANTPWFQIFVNPPIYQAICSHFYVHSLTFFRLNSYFIELFRLLPVVHISQCLMCYCIHCFLPSLLSHNFVLKCKRSHITHILTAHATYSVSRSVALLFNHSHTNKYIRSLLM